MPRGGARQGAGRKAKADEIALIEKMDARLAPDEVWAALAAKVLKGDTNALKLWLSYRYGQPKQSIDLSNDDGTLNPVHIIQLPSNGRDNSPTEQVSE